MLRPCEIWIGELCRQLPLCSYFARSNVIMHLVKFLGIFIKCKAEPAKGFSFGSSAIFPKDPPLSYPFSRRDRLCRDDISLNSNVAQPYPAVKEAVISGYFWGIA